MVFFYLQLDQAELGMPSREYYMKGHDDVGVQVYEQFAINVAILFGANASNAEREIREMIDFEIKLANVSLITLYVIYALIWP